VVQPQLQAGRLRALAVTAPRRMPQLPNVPTAAESFPGYQAGSFLAIAGPSGLPPGIVDRLNAAIRQAVSHPDVRQRLVDLGGEPLAGSPADMAAEVRNAIEGWKTVIRTRNIKAD
jgi:tripartite-type tricarboxylate transporter receptor subunit TctC